MDQNDIDQCIKAIAQTGFMLESRVASALRERQWSVLGNRYYLDDITAVPREIDLIAYKARTVDKATVYTALIISCKKSDQNSWVFLTKTLNKLDRNIELYPVNIWSNSKILVHLDIRKAFVSAISENILQNGLLNSMFSIDRNVFAYQEVNLSNGTPQNDKRIYDSITTCIKAMEYERNALKARKRAPCLYQFVILNVVESRLLEYFCELDPPVVAEADHVKYLNRFIVNKADDFRIIHFVKDSHLGTFLDLMEDYHQWSIAVCSSVFDQYRARFLSDSGLRNLFAEEVANDLKFSIQIRAKYALHIDDFKIDKINFSSDAKNQVLVLFVGTSDEDALRKLNEDPWLRSKIAASLKERASYEGPFMFGGEEYEDDIPF